MKNFTIILFISFPLFIFAQKGVVVPDVKAPATTIVTKNNLPSDIKTWIIEENLVNCIDTLTKCFVVKEDGITKSVSEEDVFDFIYEDGYRFTILVKEELKTPPISLNAGNYTYTLYKIISKKLIDKNSSTSYTDIPTVTKNEITSKTDDNNPETPITNYEAASKEEVFSLKKQVRDLKKQVDVMQLQLDMLMQVIIKK